jgi:hypothetical protein
MEYAVCFLADTAQESTAMPEALPVYGKGDVGSKTFYFRDTR